MFAQVQFYHYGTKGRQLLVACQWSSSYPVFQVGPWSPCMLLKGSLKAVMWEPWFAIRHHEEDEVTFTAEARAESSTPREVHRISDRWNEASPATEHQYSGPGWEKLDHGLYQQPTLPARWAATRLTKDTEKSRGAGGPVRVLRTHHSPALSPW